MLLHVVYNQLFSNWHSTNAIIVKPGLILNSFDSQVPLIGLLHRPKIFLGALVSIYILTRISFVTQIEFPYHDDSNHNPTPQRHFITVKLLVKLLPGGVHFSPQLYLYVPPFSMPSAHCMITMAE